MSDKHFIDFGTVDGDGVTIVSGIGAGSAGIRFPSSVVRKLVDAAGRNHGVTWLLRPPVARELVEKLNLVMAVED